MATIEKNLYRIAIVLSVLGIFFALIKGSVFWAMFDAFMGAWFTNCLAEMKREERRK